MVTPTERSCVTLSSVGVPIIMPLTKLVNDPTAKLACALPVISNPVPCLSPERLMPLILQPVDEEMSQILSNHIGTAISIKCCAIYNACGLAHSLHRRNRI